MIPKILKMLLLTRWQWETWTQRRPLSRFTYSTHSSASPTATFSAHLDSLPSLFGTLQASFRCCATHEYDTCGNRSDATHSSYRNGTHAPSTDFFQALLVPPLYLGRVARRLKGPNSAKVDIYVYQRKPSRNSKLTGHHNLTLVDGQNSVVFVMQMVQFASVVKFSQVPQPTCFAKSK